eukprot:TRINITY_DN12358_c0_g1_i1.p1 TRINITY_DN12358_c0_g1~~TRINITY_DN12358_c0_g1_i1.p1  ORF type:complete len:635 (+),score=80.00 TRINITY_DN12358_c0_g1_i1:56-1906(+)
MNNNIISLIKNDSVPIKDKCFEIHRYLVKLNEERKSSPFLMDFVEAIFESVFHFTNGWIYARHKEDQNAVIQLLLPNSTLFQLLMWMNVHDASFFIGYQHLPAVIQNMIATNQMLPSLYRRTWNPDQRRVELNVLPYYFTFFALSITEHEFMSYSDDPTCYTALLHSYLNYYMRFDNVHYPDDGFGQFLHGQADSIFSVFYQVIIFYWLGKNDKMSEARIYKPPSPQLVLLIQDFVLHELHRMHPDYTNADNLLEFFRGPIVELKFFLFLFIQISLRQAAKNRNVPIDDIISLWYLYMKPWESLDNQRENSRLDFMTKISQYLNLSPNSKRRSLEDRLGNEFISMYIYENFPFYYYLYFEFIRFCSRVPSYMERNMLLIEHTVRLFSTENILSKKLDEIETMCENNANQDLLSVFEYITGKKYNPSIKREFHESLQGFMFNLSKMNRNPNAGSLSDIFQYKYNVNTPTAAPTFDDFQENIQERRVPKEALYALPKHTPFKERYRRKITAVQFNGAELSRPVTSYEIGFLVRIFIWLSIIIEKQTGKKLNLRFLADKGNFFWLSVIFGILGASIMYNTAVHPITLLLTLPPLIIALIIALLTVIPQTQKKQTTIRRT